MVCCTNFAEVSDFRLLDIYLYIYIVYSRPTYMGMMCNLSVIPPIIFLRKDNRICVGIISSVLSIVNDIQCRVGVMMMGGSP